MNCIIVLATIACVLNVVLASSSHRAEDARSEVMSYVAENMGSVRMMRSNRAHLECYNGFIPLINSLAQKAKEKSNACVNDADVRKDQAIAALDRKAVEAEVQKITNSLADCSKQNGLDYFSCFVKNAEKHQQILELIKTKSQEMLSQNTNAVNEIDSDENSCIMDAVDKAKRNSDRAFDTLKSCINGGDSFDKFVTEA